MNTHDANISCRPKKYAQPRCMCQWSTSRSAYLLLTELSRRTLDSSLTKGTTRTWKRTKQLTDHIFCIKSGIWTDDAVVLFYLYLVYPTMKQPAKQIAKATTHTLDTALARVLSELQLSRNKKVKQHCTWKKKAEIRKEKRRRRRRLLKLTVMILRDVLVHASHVLSLAIIASAQATLSRLVSKW